MADVLCPTCGKPNSENREFCDFCGNPLDGALPADPEGSSLRKGIFSKEGPDLSLQEQEGMDEASRLDSLISEAEKGETIGKDALSGPESDSSRLDDYLPIEETPAGTDSIAPDQPLGDFDDSSRLDDYLQPEDYSEEPSAVAGAQDQSPIDSSSRLDEYFSEEDPTPSLPEDFQDQETTEESSRLDEYLSGEEITPSPTPDTIPAPEPAEEPSPLDDFFAEDPFKSSDPFQEPAKSKESELPEGEFDPFRLPPEELELPSELESKLTDPGSADEQENPWDFSSKEFDQAPTGQENTQAPDDASEWDLFDSGDTPETTPSQGTDEAPIGDTSAGEWDFLDSGSAPVQSEGEEGQPEPKSSKYATGELDFLDPGLPGDLTEEGPADTPASEDSGGEWDFIDPGLDGEQPAGEASQGASAPDGTAPGDFDWLDPGPEADLPEDAEPVGDELPEFDSQGFEEDSDWLDMLQGPGARKPSPAESPKPKKPQTDWLEKIKRLNKSSDLVDEDSSFPDWLAVSEQQAAKPEEPEQKEPEEQSSEVPDWLKLDDDDSIDEFLKKKDLTNEEYKPKITDAAHREGKGEDPDAPASGLSDSQQIKFPSWAEEQKRKDQEKARQQDRSGGLKSAEPFQVEEDYFDDLFDEELPGWLTSASSQEISEPFIEELTQGELPGWVEAMRPVVESTDASGLAEDEDYIENYGPLAGIPSVLPAEPEVGIALEGATKKPLDLLVNKSHQDYVNLLKRILGDENKTKTIQQPAPLQPQRVLRWLIAIVLLIATAVTIIFGGTIDTQPPSLTQIQGSGYAALYDQIEKLYEGQPVLIAYDYQPATAGELHTAAAGVVDHLMEQGTFLSFVSTQPTGPALAEQFLDTTQAEHGYLHTQKYINLGYLPGESAGLLSFMIAPKQIIPLAFDGSNAWDSPPLIGVDSISDFKMILVITDDPNIAKTWIEQVGTQLKDTPLTMVVSAQVEPLIQPYFRSNPRPLAGYVAGVIDSMNYEQLTNKPNLASKYWLPFNMGIVISVSIIFISGLANGVLSLFSRRRTKLLGDTK